ncbi:MAG: M23 family metallopeptidase [Lachnospiraceae bacterium]|nr:M23 family metallopeptidase [Lachnospiraceae bacterium]
MKKFGFKKRAQWGFYKAALLGAAFAVLLAPAAYDILNIKTKSNKDAVEEKSLTDFFGTISFGEKTKVVINGDVVAISKGKEAGEAAFKAARLAYNAKGVKLLNLDVSYEKVDKEKDAGQIKDLRVQQGDELTATILSSLSAYDEKKKLAYTMRIDDYTVTVENFQDLIEILEKAQGKYDENNRFQVELTPCASRNVTMYEVGISDKTEKEAPAGTEGDEAAWNQGDVHLIDPPKVRLTGEKAEGAEEAEEPEKSGEPEKAEKPEEQEKEEETEKPKPSEQFTAQAVDDGVKYIGFSEKIQVMETYVSEDQIKDKDMAYTEITQENDEKNIYVVKSGDYLDLIAKKTNMTVEQIKEMNPGIESDENLYYDDRLNIIVPNAAVQVLVQKQETYQETYNEDIVYEDDDSMFIGETKVLEEGSSGTHIVTDLVTYNGDIESGREQLQETVEVAAVAQVVRRGTKSKPTYMYPVTNWNVTSNFGYRWGRLHAGTDVGVPIGTTVRASRSGKVSVAGWVGGYGNCVMIDHGDGITTVYGHLSEINCSTGQYVDQGQQIALSGNTGRSTGPHLHFEIRVNGSAEDATPFLEGQK